MTMIVVAADIDNRGRAERIVDAMLADGMDASLAIFLPEATNWSDPVTRALDARCVVCCLGAVADPAKTSSLRILTERAAHRGTAIGVLFGTCPLPPYASSMTVYRLTDGQLDPSWILRPIVGDLFLRDIVAAARSKAAGIDPPPPTAPARLARRWAWSASVALFGLVSTIGTIAGFHDYIPWPRWKEERAWAALGNDCDALAQFRAVYPHGRHADKADSVLARPMISTTFARRERPVPIAEEEFSSGTGADIASAAKALQDRLASRVGRVCMSYVDNIAGSRLVGVTLAPSEMDCQAAASSATCRPKPRAQAKCQLLEPQQHEVCPVS